MTPNGDGADAEGSWLVSIVFPHARQNWAAGEIAAPQWGQLRSAEGMAVRGALVGAAVIGLPHVLQN
jgi:hypothetical protein